MARLRILVPVATALAAAVALLGASPASAAPSGTWTINLDCRTENGQQIDIVVVDYSFDGLNTNTAGFVAGRHNYGPGMNDFVQTLNNTTTDGAGHTANTYEVLKSHLSFGAYTPTAGDVFDWRVSLDGAGIVLTGSTPLGGTGCAGSVITPGTPTISGTAKVGMVLSAVPGSWSPSGVALSYQWHADGTPIPGATGQSLPLTATHLGRVIAVKVTGSRTGLPTVSVTSATTPNVAPGTLAPPPQPKIKGTPKVGKKLTAKAGSWGPGTVLSYQWYANGKAISGAKSKKLKLKASHAGKRITVRVTGTQAGYEPITKRSAATAKVKH
ncbi:MAG TPA: hypothetical protein VFV89_03800 [Nocardioides sp.]|uniref:hypothetical protein n=1 Tax=Nocardioides sp. TaxID=35761 RepID=UPI002E381E5A|nr:hypothetical protein [Nocardioides sp.]HEX5086907.1 hypothetical protein [Nocardioides sp.]